MAAFAKSLRRNEVLPTRNRGKTMRLSADLAGSSTAKRSITRSRRGPAGTLFAIASRHAAAHVREVEAARPSSRRFLIKFLHRRREEAFLHPPAVPLLQNPAPFL